MNNNPFRLFVLIALAMVAIWFFFIREKGEVQARVPKLNENLLLACMSWADLKD